MTGIHLREGNVDPMMPTGKTTERQREDSQENTVKILTVLGEGGFSESSKQIDPLCQLPAPHSWYHAAGV